MATRRKNGKRPAASNGDGASNGNGAFRTRHISRVEASRASDSTKQPSGRLILIGGAEDREGEMVILRQVAARARGGRLAVVTAASSEPAEMWALYRRVFTQLGVEGVVHAPIDSRDDAYDPARIEQLKPAKVIFFTGGDQVRITSQLGGSRI